MGNYTSDEEYVYLNRNYAEAYIPDDLFPKDTSKNNPIYSEYGDGYRIVGIFNIRYFESDEDKRESTKLMTFSYPNTIECYPSGDTEVLTLTLNGVTDKYRVLKFYRGDIMMSAYSVQAHTNCEMFMGLISSGKLPKSLDYDADYTAWVKNWQINGQNPGVPWLILQIMVSEQCRYSKDPSKQFRKVVGTPGVRSDEYTIMDANGVSAYSSIMTAMAFERLTDKLATSLTMTKTGVQQNQSPVEKVLTM